MYACGSLNLVYSLFLKQPAETNLNMQRKSDQICKDTVSYMQNMKTVVIVVRF